MKPSPTYLTCNRHGTFYFRIVIPRPLRALLNGQREVRRTLRTDSERLARRRARQFAARYESAFDKVVRVLERDEFGLTDADYEELIELGLVSESEPSLDFSSPQDDDGLAEPILSAEENEAARTATVLTQHKPVCQLTKKDWQDAYDAARRLRKGAKASIAPNPATAIDDLLTCNPLEMVGQEVTTATIRLMSSIRV